MAIRLKKIVSYLLNTLIHNCRLVIAQTRSQEQVKGLFPFFSGEVACIESVIDVLYLKPRQRRSTGHCLLIPSNFILNLKPSLAQPFLETFHISYDGLYISYWFSYISKKIEYDHVFYKNELSHETGARDLPFLKKSVY
jgi:hypothetical protein